MQLPAICGLRTYPRKIPYNSINLRMAGQDGKITTENAIPRDCIVQVFIVGIDDHREVKVSPVIHGPLQDRLSAKEKRERTNYDHLFTDIAEHYGHNNKKYLAPFSSIRSQQQPTRPAKRPPAEASKAMGHGFLIRR